MLFADVHMHGNADTENALMSAHFAAKCIGEAEAAIMSQHVAQQCARTSLDNLVFYRYF